LTSVKRRLGPAATRDLGAPGLGRSSPCNGRTPSAASASAARTAAERRQRHVVVTTQDDDGRVIHAIRYDETLEHVLEELEGDEAEAVFGKGKSEKNESPEEPDAAEGL